MLLHDMKCLKIVYNVMYWWCDCWDRSLVDTVYALKDQVKELQSSISLLSSQLEEETKARHTLQNIVHTHLLSANKDDIQWPENWHTLRKIIFSSEQKKWLTKSYWTSLSNNLFLIIDVQSLCNHTSFGTKKVFKVKFIQLYAFI